MNIYIDICESADWESSRIYGGTYMWFDALPNEGDILDYIDVTPFLKNNNALNEVPDGNFEVLCNPFPIDDNPFHCRYKIFVCPVDK